MNKAILFLLAVMLCLAASAQTIEVSGTVKDLAGKPVADVIVKVTSEKTTLAFATTNALGAYALTYDHSKAKGGEVVLSFSHISYDKEEVTLKGDKRKVQENVMLIPKTIALKEVKVKAEPLRLKGDTLSYNLASFLGKGDVTLEDGLKRLPGIEVSKDGAISYMGQGISKFYIEGLDMLGGRYNLATKNIPAEYATQVEVLRHHKARRVDADEESDAVALNIKLAKKAKFKPFGQETMGVGVAPHSAPEGATTDLHSGSKTIEAPSGAVRGALGVTGMMFTDKFQLLGSAKFSNHGNFGSYDIIDHYGNNHVSTLATSTLGSWNGGRPPLGDYLYETNGFVTLNGITKMDSTRQLRMNADYTYGRRHNSYETMTTYYLPDASLPLGGVGEGSGVTIGELSHPLTRVHRPMLELRYEDNAQNHYFMETLRLQAQFEENECPVASDDGTGLVLHHQQREAQALRLQNDIWGTIHKGGHKQSYRSEIEFSRAPKVQLSFGNGTVQTGQSTSLYTNHTTTFTLKLGKKWRIGLPMYLNADYNMIETNSHLGQQRLGGWHITPSVSPNTEWRSANKKAYVSMGVGLRWKNLNYKAPHSSPEGDTNVSNSGNNTTEAPSGAVGGAFSDFFAEPSARFRYTFSGTSELTLSSGFRHSTGDILDLLTTPVQTNYRNTSVASGIIGKTQQWNSSLDYKHQVPFSYFSFDAHASWTQGKRNVLSSQTVSGTSVALGSLLSDSHFKSASGTIALSKNILTYTDIGRHI